MDTGNIAEKMMEKWLLDIGSKSLSAITPPSVLSIMMICGYSWWKIAGDNSSYFITFNIILFVLGSTIFWFTSRKSAHLSWMNGGFFKSGRLMIMVVSVMFAINTVPLTKTIIELSQGPDIILNDVEQVINQWGSAKEMTTKLFGEEKNKYIKAANENNEINDKKRIEIINFITDIEFNAKTPGTDGRCHFNMDQIKNLTNLGFVECVTSALSDTYTCKSVTNGVRDTSPRLISAINSYKKCIINKRNEKYPIINNNDIDIAANKIGMKTEKQESSIIKISNEQINIMKDLMKEIKNNKNFSMENTLMISNVRNSLLNSNNKWIENIKSEEKFRELPEELPISSSIKITSKSGVLSFITNLEITKLPPQTIVSLLGGIFLEITVAFLFTRYIQKVAPQMKKYDTLRYANDISDGNGPTGIRWLLLPALPPSEQRQTS